MDRRAFLRIIPLAASVPVLAGTPVLGDILFGEDDALICSKKFAFAVSLNLRQKPIGDVVVGMGKSFLGTDYIANTLEQPGKEHLVVNLQGLDCVTFYENALVFARCIKKNRVTFADYKAELQFVRYRGGVINGYPSRLHYFCDYIFDNEKKGVLNDVTKSVGGAPYQRTINFMSTHPESYRQLKEQPEFIKVIQEQESAINKRSLYHVPKEMVVKLAPKIQNGDILGITTEIAGIDVSHTGLAIWQNDQLHFLHAPITGSKVEITQKTLAEYLAASSKRLGIMVARPLEPA